MMMDKLKILFEQYNFDYININPKDISDLDFLYNAEMILIDNASGNYLGEIKINNVKIKVYYDKKITPGDVIFKYDNIKKERNIKIKKIK